MCRPGVLIYKVDAEVDTGMGPVSVLDSRRDSGGCTHAPNVHAELSDAPFTPGETFRDAARGITIEVTGVGAGAAGAGAGVEEGYRVRVTRE